MIIAGSAIYLGIIVRICNLTTIYIIKLTNLNLQSNRWPTMKENIKSNKLTYVLFAVYLIVLFWIFTV